MASQEQELSSHFCQHKPAGTCSSRQAHEPGRKNGLNDHLQCLPSTPESPAPTYEPPALVPGLPQLGQFSWSSRSQ